ncbi:MAG: SH3 domain-containing protein [Anaerolineaceae bacterium]|nr:SH3 domain-containing protein [Anaerolineaceae bacterium]
MSRMPLWQKLIFGLALLLPLACNLTTVDPTPTLLPTIPATIQRTTATPTVTATVTATATATTRAPIPSGPTATPLYRLTQPLPAAICSVVPNVDASNIRSGPGTNFPVIGVILANNWVMASRLSSSGWYQIAAPGTVVNGGWISSTVVNLQQPCICTPDSCAQSGIVPPTLAPSPIPKIGVVGLKPSGVGPCVITAGDVDLEVYNSPQGLPPVIAILVAHGGLPTFKLQDGRYAVNFSTETQQLVGWVNANRVTIEGDCGQVTAPVICSVQASIGPLINIYAEPSRDSKVVSSMNEFLTVPFIQFNADGWFNVNLGFVGSGWIAPNEGKLVGPCDNGH